MEAEGPSDRKTDGDGKQKALARRPVYVYTCLYLAVLRVACVSVYMSTYMHVYMYIHGICFAFCF